MAKVTNLKQAIEETVRLLQSEKYQTYKEVVTICRKQIAQARILELFDLSETKDTIADGTGQDEKTIRFWLNGDQEPTLSNLIQLEEYHKKVKAKHARKSTS